MKYLISNTDFNPQDIGRIGEHFHVESRLISSFSVLMEQKTSVHKTAKLNAFLDGYIREFGFRPEEVEKQIKKGVKSISNTWPVNEDVTGSFSCAIITELEEIILCNDPIGVYPVYYLNSGSNFYISNSIIWLGALSRAKIDEVGLFQRTYCPEFANVGTRTVLEGCKRLLPGEWIKFNKSGSKLETKYDNKLYEEISSPNDNSITPQEYWNQFKKELNYCAGNEKNIHVALSGGMDSRLLLGGISSDKNLTCHTYGNQDFYETGIAEKLASLRQANFRSYSEPELNFPERNILRKYTAETEAVYLCTWLEILEAQDKSKKNILLLGDMTESLQGRNLAFKKTFKTYWNYYVRNRKISFRKTSKENFEGWKEKILFTYSRLISNEHIECLHLSISEKELRRQIKIDLDNIFQRIEAHNLPLMELVQELFSWFTHARNPMGKQIIQLNTEFHSYCPSMSIQCLRVTSNIHPARRVNGKYMKSLFGTVNELKHLGKIATSQIPFIAYNAPDIFKLPIWFFRSKVDNVLIERLMKSKDPGKRYRFLKSYNWVAVYQKPNLEKILRSYFQQDFLGEKYTDGIIKGALSRKNLESWPLVNVNIINAAALNLELELIFSLKNDGF